MAKQKEKDAREMAMKNFQGFVFGPEAPCDLIPTGHAHLDQIISSAELESVTKESAEESEVISGGLPRGKIVMIYGDPSGGKSSLAYRICGYAQRIYPNEIPIWFDMENSFSPTLAEINGCDINFLGRFMTHDPENPENVYSMENIMDQIMATIKKGASVIVLDSAKSMTPQYVWDNPAEKETMALRARVFAKTLPKIASLAAAHNCLVIIINQLSHDPSNMWNPEGTSGGNTLKHLCSVILKVKKTTSKDKRITIESEDGEDVVIAQMSNVYVEKNRFGAPHYGAVEIPIYFRHYFPAFEEVLFNTGRQTKVIAVRTKVYSWDGIKAEGRNAFIQALKDNTDKQSKLVNEIKEAAKEAKIPLPPEILNAEKHLCSKIKTEEEVKKSKKGKKKADSMIEGSPEEVETTEEAIEVPADVNPGV